MHEESRPDDVRALAREVVERIVRDPSFAETLADRLALQYTCPPGKLCCDQGYGCDSPFVCRPGFDCKVSFALYPP